MIMNRIHMRTEVWAARHPEHKARDHGGGGRRRANMGTQIILGCPRGLALT